MMKEQRKKRQKYVFWRTLQSVALIVLILPTFFSIAYGECDVGDTTQGRWVKIANPKDCPFVGPPHADSPWPHDAEYNMTAYAISGKYYIREQYGSLDSSLDDGVADCTLIPIDRPKNCIEGFREAMATAYANQINNSSSGCYDAKVEGALVTYEYTCADDQNPIKVSWCSVVYDIYEWHCYDEKTANSEQNFGGQCSIEM